MTDEKYIAIETIKERKSIASSARKRKTHNGKGGCTLPHESMTKKELDALNGPAVTVDPRKPMTWDEFKALPSSSQEYYVSYLAKHYHVSGSDLCRMFKIATSTFVRHVKYHPGIKVYKRASKPGPEERKLLDEFYVKYGIADRYCGDKVRGSYTNQSKARFEAAQAIEESAKERAVSVPAPEGFKEFYDSVQNTSATECHVGSFNITFNGPVDLQAVMDAIRNIVDGVDGRLAIRFDRKENT